MEQKVFSFDEATPFQEFIDRHHDMIVGHMLKAVCSNMGLFVKTESDETIFLVLDDLCLGIEYLFLGHIKLIAADPSDLEILDAEQDKPESRKVIFHSRLPKREDDLLEWDAAMPGTGQRITAISIKRFSEGYEDYPDSYRPDGGDYFSEITLTLESGIELHFCAEDALYDGYIDIWLTGMPAYESIKAEMDMEPFDLGMRMAHEFDDIVLASKPAPDELAELAMYYMRKCDHEIERYRAENEYPIHGFNTMYTDQLQHIVNLFVEQGMNTNYSDSTGKTLRDLAMEIGEEAGKLVRPLIDPK